MKPKEIRKLSGKEIEKKVLELKEELSKLHGQAATSTPPKNPGRIKQIKRTLARIKTISHEGSLGINRSNEKLQEEKK